MLRMNTQHLRSSWPVAYVGCGLSLFLEKITCGYLQSLQQTTALAFCAFIGMDHVKSTYSFFTDVEDGSAFLSFLGCFASLLFLSDGVSLSTPFFQKFSFLIGEIMQTT